MKCMRCNKKANWYSGGIRLCWTCYDKFQRGIIRRNCKIWLEDILLKREMETQQLFTENFPEG